MAGGKHKRESAVKAAGSLFDYKLFKKMNDA
jgi:hypothetical protein